MWVGVEPDAVVVAAAATEAAEVDEEPEPPYCAKAGTSRVERNRAEAANVCILADVYGR